MSAVPDILRNVLGAQGINFGINIGRAAGASIPNHLHIHVLPRMKNESATYIQSILNITVVTWDLHKLFDQLKPAFDELKEKL